MKRCLTIILLLAVLLLAGCKEELPEYSLEIPTTELTTAPTTESVTGESATESTAAKQWRDYATYPVERPTDHVIGNARYYTEARAVSYYDTELDRAIYLCSQPNCTHSDAKCTAYLGGSMGSSYIVAGDLVYALIDRFDEDGTIRLIEKNLITGKTRLLWDLSPEGNRMREFFTFSLCENEAFLTFRQCEISYTFEGNNSTVKETNAVHYSYSVDLTTAERELLLEAKIPSVEGYCLSGSVLIPQVCTGDYLLIHEVSYSDKLPLSKEDYYKQNPGGDYETYIAEVLREFSTDGYYSLNRKTGEKIPLYIDGENSVRDKKMAFVRDHTVCIYDGYTGEVTEYFTQERVGMLMYLDGRIFFNVYPEGNSQTDLWDFFWYDLTTGERQQFQKGIDTMVFSIHGETKDYFYGIYNGRVNSFISKQDFYNENYDAAF